MISEFGKYVHAVRQFRRLRIVDVVRLMNGYSTQNEAKRIRRLTELERTGQCPPQFFNRVAEALELDPRKLVELAEAHEQNIERVLNLPATPLLRWQHRWTVTKFGLIWREKYMAVGTSIPQALAYASKLAKDEHVEVHVHVSPRQVVLVDESGSIRRVERAHQPFAVQDVMILGRRLRLRVFR